MGCQSSKDYIPTFQIQLMRTSLKPLDDLYEEIERVISQVQCLKESVEIVIDKFETVTGLQGPPHKSLAVGILGFVISLLANAKCDVAALDLYFSDSIPGLVLNENALSSSDLIVYHSWLELMQFLEAGVEHLQEIAPRLGKLFSASKLNPETALFVTGQLENLRAIDFRKLEITTNANFLQIKETCEMVSVLLTSIKGYVDDTVTTTDELSTCADLTPLLKLARKSIKRGLVTVPSIVQEFSFELDQLVSAQRTLIQRMNSDTLV